MKKKSVLRVKSKKTLKLLNVMHVIEDYCFLVFVMSMVVRMKKYLKNKIR